MTDEEKEAIEYLKHCKFFEIYYDDELHKQTIQVILNLIEKQDKRIDELEKTLKTTQDSWFKDTKRLDEKAKIIHEMAKEIIILDEVGQSKCSGCKNKRKEQKCIECRINDFKNKVKGEKK